MNLKNAAFALALSVVLSLSIFHSTANAQSVTTKPCTYTLPTSYIDDAIAVNANRLFPTLFNNANGKAIALTNYNGALDFYAFSPDVKLEVQFYSGSTEYVELYATANSPNQRYIKYAGDSATQHFNAGFSQQANLPENVKTAITDFNCANYSTGLEYATNTVPLVPVIWPTPSGTDWPALVHQSTTPTPTPPPTPPQTEQSELTDRDKKFIAHFAAISIVVMLSYLVLKPFVYKGHE